MNVATGCLVFLAFILALLGVASKFLGLSLLAPYINSTIGYLGAANFCLLTALIVDKFQKS